MKRDMLDRFIRQLAKRGLVVLPSDKEGELIVRGPRHEVTEEVMRGLKAFKPAFIERLKEHGDKPPEEPQSGEANPTTAEDATTICRVCRAWVDPLYSADMWEMCKRHATRGSKNVPPTMGCPYKPNSNGTDHSPYG